MNTIDEAWNILANIQGMGDADLLSSVELGLEILKMGRHRAEQLAEKYRAQETAEDTGRGDEAIARDADAMASAFEGICDALDQMMEGSSCSEAETAGDYLDRVVRETEEML